MKTIARGFACLLASSVCVAACANENLPSPHDPASATVNEPSQCGQDSDCKDGQRCVVGSCTSAKLSGKPRRFAVGGASGLRRTRPRFARRGTIGFVRPDANLLRTQVAQSTNVFSASFNAIFASMVLSPGGYVPEMTTPDGQSTGGGKLAGQKIRLVPKQPGFSTIVVGDANPALKHAELRTFEAVDEAHREHFKRPVALDSREYAAFVAKAKAFFERQEMSVTIMLPSMPEGEAAKPSGGSGMLMGFLMGAAVAILAGFAFWYFRR